MMEGSMQVESEFGVGSSFGFTAWFQTADGLITTRPARDEGLSEIARRLEPVHGRHILVVDDQRSGLAFAARLLKKLGLRSTCVQSGQAAIDAVSARRFSAVLMDLQMPGPNGYQASREIIARLGDEAPPILAMTAAVLEQHRQAGQEAGMVEHIGKPIDAAELATALLRHVSAAGDVSCPATRRADRNLRDRVDNLLPELERLLRDRDISATTLAGDIEGLLAETELAAHFTAVVNATRQLRPKEASVELEKFRRRLGRRSER